MFSIHHEVMKIRREDINQLYYIDVNQHVHQYVFKAFDLPYFQILTLRFTIFQDRSSDLWLLILMI